MFGKLKEKLKNWIKKSKKKIEKTEEAPSEEAPSDKKLKKQAEKIEKEAPQKFNVALQKYEPDTEKIKEEIGVKEGAEPLAEEPRLPEEEAGTAIEIERETEEGIPQEDIDAELEKKELEKPTKKSLMSKLRLKFAYKISEGEFNDIFEDLEMLLLENNTALEVVEDIKKKLSEKLVGKEIKQENLEKEIRQELKNSLNEILIEPDDPLATIRDKKETQDQPFIILFFGINGTGKTTTIAKIASMLKQNNLSCVFAAADTFRAASIEQIQEHADKLNIPLIKQDYGSDPSAVGYDAIEHAKKHKIDVVLIDTAGRMHTRKNLLAEMEKICRVTKPDLKIFVAESIAGNDATEQAKAFNEMIEIDGSILTKADIDEKGGTIISISHTTKKPIFYLGTGQDYEDIKLFNKQDFIKSLGL